MWHWVESLIESALIHLSCSPFAIGSWDLNVLKVGGPYDKVPGLVERLHELFSGKVSLDSRFCNLGNLFCVFVQDLHRILGSLNFFLFYLGLGKCIGRLFGYVVDLNVLRSHLFFEALSAVFVVEFLLWIWVVSYVGKSNRYSFHNEIRVGWNELQFIGYFSQGASFVNIVVIMYLSLKRFTCLFLTCSVVINEFLGHSSLYYISIELKALGVYFGFEFVE